MRVITWFRVAGLSKRKSEDFYSFRQRLCFSCTVFFTSRCFIFVSTQQTLSRSRLLGVWRTADCFKFIQPRQLGNSTCSELLCHLKCVCVWIDVMWLGPWSARFPHRCWPNTQVSDAAHSSSIRIRGKPHKRSLVQLIFWRESASVSLTPQTSRLERIGPGRLSAPKPVPGSSWGNSGTGSQDQLCSWSEPCFSLAGDVSSVLNGKFPEGFSSWNRVVSTGVCVKVYLSSLSSLIPIIPCYCSVPPSLAVTQGPVCAKASISMCVWAITAAIVPANVLIH